MKNFRLKFFILSAILITICSGLLFYRQLFIDEIRSEYSQKGDVEELRNLDLQLNSAMLAMRANLNEGSDEILGLKNRINDALNILFDSKKNQSSEVKNSLLDIKNYFTEKNKNIDKYLMDIREIQSNVKSLNSIYNEIQKSNLKFALDGKDFYRECITDTFTFLIMPSKDVEWKFNEDIKILTQIMGFSKTPSNIIERYYKAMDTIKTKSKEADTILQANKDKNISSDLSIVMKYESENKELTHTKGQTFLILIFISIVGYVASIIFVMRKL